MTNKKAIVTGGCGFIGSHLVRRLILEGHEKVLVVDDLSAGTKTTLTRITEDLRPIQQKRIDIEVMDITHRPSELTSVAKGYDEIYHLAAEVGVRRILSGPISAAKRAVDGFLSIIGAAYENHCRVFFASTSQVYGLNPGICCEDDPINFGHSLVWSYAASKALGEYMFRAAAEAYNIPVVIGRYFNVIGPGQSIASHVLPLFISAALDGRPLDVHGDGNQERAFIEVEDAARITFQLMQAPDAMGETVNIGSAQMTTGILALALRVKAVLNSKSEIAIQPYDHVYGPGYDDVRARIPDITKMSDLILGTAGSLKHNDLDEIVERTADYIRFYRSGK